MTKIIHIDMDCFYAAIEMRERPELRGKPMAVGYSHLNRGVLTTANYEARKFGVKSAMPTKTAVKLCPHLIMVEPRFELYSEESGQLRDIFSKYTSRIEPIALDEAYLDVTENLIAFQGSATLLAQALQREIFSSRQLTASAGVAPNKFLAKVASDWNKPAGLTVISDRQVMEFVKKLSVRSIPGVGPKNFAKLEQAGLLTCEDVQKIELFELKRKFGSFGVDLYFLSRGIDERPVESERPRRSLSVENTFEKDLVSWHQVSDEIDKIYDELVSRLEELETAHYSSLFIKVKTAQFKVFTREEKWTGRLNKNIFFSLFKKWQEPLSTPLRLIGMGVRFRQGDKLHTDGNQLELNL